MNILVIGQTTMEMGRMEFGNIGNYYVLEPFFREVHRAFPGARVETTLQLSDRFCRDEAVIRLPIELYYDSTNDNMEKVVRELELAQSYINTGELNQSTPFIEAVMRADVVLDFSGDIWGSNADLLASDRFVVGLYKDKIAQLLGKPTCLMSSSPGPFDTRHIDLAKEVFEHFDLVANREPISRQVLESYGFNTSRVIDSACPAYLFEVDKRYDHKQLSAFHLEIAERRPVVGLVVCGFNFARGPHTAWPRNNSEYAVFVEAAKYVIDSLGAQVCLMSHSNGFTLPPEDYREIHGSDYKHALKLYEILEREGYGEKVFLMSDIYSPWTTKEIIGNFSMLVSGRIHGAVAGLSQCIPTVVFDYGHEPKAHKLEGFTKLMNMDRYLCDPTDREQVVNSLESCWAAKENIRTDLADRLRVVRNFVYLAFDKVASLAAAKKTNKG